LGRDVAIKLLAPELASDPEMVSRFTDEAKNASRLMHQNIATVFEAGPSPAGWYVAFEMSRAGRSRPFWPRVARD